MLFGWRKDNQLGADATGASPGYTYGKSGNVGSNTYLLNDTVPSNRTGRFSTVNGIIAEAFIAGEYGSTYNCTMAIEIRYGGTGALVEVLTLTLSAQRSKVQTFSVAVSQGDEIACKIKTGSIKNPDVGIQLKGDTI